MKAEVLPNTTLTLNITLSGDEVREALHELLNKRYKQPCVVKAISIVTPPVVGKDLSIQFKVSAEFAPVMDVLSNNSGGVANEDPC